MDIFHHTYYEDEALLYDHATKCDPEPEKFQPHSHTTCELIFFKQGNISYTVDGRSYRLSRNHLVFSRPFAIHSIAVDGDDAYERYNILFDEKTLPYDLLSKLPTRLDVLNFDGNLSVIQIFDKMDYYCEHLKLSERGRALAHLVEEIFFNIMLEAETADVNPYTQTNGMICAAVAYIEEHLTTLSGIDEICRELYITKSHLHHLFAKYLQSSPKKYITAKRLALAQREICSGGKPTEVCGKCGFSDYSAFYRAYVAYYGRKPSERISQESVILSHDNTPQRMPGEGKIVEK